MTDTSEQLPEEPAPRSEVVSAKVRSRIAVAITVLWGLSVLSSMVAVWFGKDFTVNPWVGATMLGTAAAIYGSDFLRGIDRR